ncbi:MAG: sugar ABC transporter permease [Thermomicrobiales bacterium]|nr:sugar ABC transporter permease [Thermomicrobiales bacterium]
MLRTLMPRTNRGRETLMALVFASPWFIGMAILVIGPFFMALYYSFTDYKIMGNTQWIGLENYRRLFDDDRFIHSLKNTAYFTVLSIPLSLICSLAAALLVNRPFRGSTLARTTIYLPSLFGGVFVAALASQVFSGNYGFANRLLRLIHIQGPQWLASPDWAKPTFVILGLWGIGAGMVLFLAALQSVPTHLLEAAIVDGANSLQRFWNVTLPMLSPAILFQTILLLIASFQVFTLTYVLTSGGPADSTLFTVYYIYELAFKRFDMGYASAASWILLLLTFATTALVLAIGSKYVYYEFDEESDR